MLGAPPTMKDKRITKANIRLFHAETGNRIDSENSDYIIITSPGSLVVVIKDTTYWVADITQAGVLTHFWLVPTQP